MISPAASGASACGPTEPMFMMPRSCAREVASGSTAVTSAWSTDMYAP